MLGNQARGVVTCRPRRGNMGSVREAVCRTGNALSAGHRMPRRDTPVLGFCIQLPTYGVGIEIVKENLNLEVVLPVFLFHRRGAKSHPGPVLRELRLPIQQFITE